MALPSNRAPKARRAKRECHVSQHALFAFSIIRSGAMDVLHTNIVVVEGRRYRVQSDAGGVSFGTRQDRSETKHREVARPSDSKGRQIPGRPNEGASQSTPSEDPGDGHIRTHSGEYALRVSVDADLAKRALRDSNGDAQATILRDTGARLVFPGEEENENDVVPNRGELLIVAGSVESVSKAKGLVSSLIQTELISHNTKYTHFVGIPMNHDLLVDAARSFRASVLSSGDRTWNFLEPGRLRLAVCDLKLCSDETRRKAKEAMARTEAGIREMGYETSLKATVNGVSVDKSRNSMVAGVSDSPDERLHKVCSVFRTEFHNAGLLLPGDDTPFELRIELATGKEQGSKAQSGGQTPPTYFGEVPVGISEVCLSRLDDFDVETGGYFRCVEKVSLVI